MGRSAVCSSGDCGLGFSICCRLVDEFLQTRSHGEHILIIITTRSKSKGDDTIARIQQHVRQFCRKRANKVGGTAAELESRVELRQELLDLSSLLSVQQLAKKLLTETENGTGIQRLDAIICNAGIGGWAGVNWGLLAWSLLTTGLQAVTYPPFKMPTYGLATKPQLPSRKGTPPAPEPVVGEVFCANVFGHYLLAHYLMPLLSAPTPDARTPGRIIWVSSLEAYDRSFSLDDMQGLKTGEAYECSKRLTDLLALTADLPSTAHSMDSFSRPSKAFPLPCAASLPPPPSRRPRHYVSHPGVCATAIMPLYTIIFWGMTLAFYMARWLGSLWHCVSTYAGATAPVWLALADQELLDALERDKGRSKWGSAVDIWGHEKVEQTEMDLWGWGGRPDEATKRYGRRWGAQLATTESREAFLDEGARCWVQMEQLREEWEQRLKDAHGE